MCRYILCSQLHVTAVLGGRMLSNTLKTKSLKQRNHELAHREIVRVLLCSATSQTVSCLHELGVSKGHKIIFQHFFNHLLLFAL
jgi:hypothetical protein